LRDLLRDRRFLILLAAGFALAGLTYRTPHVAMWVGFLFAGYSAVANDSIQTIGTFIASNRSIAWWKQWLFIAGVFLATVTYSWIAYDGDVSYQRLLSKGFDTAPTEFSYLQVAAPLVLLVLTRLRMPVSTTFLLLTSFATTAESVGKVLTKSLSGYAIAFGLAFALYLLAAQAVKGWTSKPASGGWRLVQWATSGLLWAVWLMQDAANIAVYLPRSLSFSEFLAFATVIVLGLGILLRNGGEKVQEVVDEKSAVVDVRAATIMNLLFAGILYWFKVESRIPMSTTWVFLGLLAGREIAMRLRSATDRTTKETFMMIGKDVGYATIGLCISVAIAAAVNVPFRAAILGF
jgi:hypothetical protein